MKKLLNTDKWKSIALPGLFILLLFLCWEIVVYVSSIKEWILPKPHAIFLEIWNSKKLIYQHSLQTLYETIIGFVLAIITAFITATIIDLSENIKKTIYPLLVISQTIPIIAVAPLIVLWFGLGTLPKVLVVSLVCFFPITINLADGYALVNKDMIKVLSSMGANRWQIFYKVKLPSALPQFFTGLRIGGTYSVMGAVIGEWLGASKGLGILLTRSSQSFLTVRVFATIFIITILSLAIYALIEVLSRLMMPWKRKVER